MKVLNLAAIHENFRIFEVFINSDGAFTQIDDGNHVNLVTVQNLENVANGKRALDCYPVSRNLSGFEHVGNDAFVRRNGGGHDPKNLLGDETVDAIRAVLDGVCVPERPGAEIGDETGRISL